MAERMNAKGDDGAGFMPASEPSAAPAVHEAAEHAMSGATTAVPVGLAAAAVALYAWAAVRAAARGRPWPAARVVAWSVGALIAAAAVAGPFAAQARADFALHMVGHVLLGMLAPLLMAPATPVALLLRALPVRTARRVARLLKLRPVALLTDPATAAVLNVGGLWLLYTTGLFAWMHTSAAGHVLVHWHVFAAGYLFTAAILQREPTPHRRGFRYRAAVLTVALGAHDALAKRIYAHPPAGVLPPAAEAGGLIMYYGGDAVDLALIILLCRAWYRTRSPRP
jgi:putative membrane protein